MVLIKKNPTFQIYLGSCRPAWQEGGCKPPKGVVIQTLQIELLNDRRYSVKECYEKCSEVDECRGFFLSTKQGHCCTYQNGCTKNEEESGWDYYEIDSCHFENGMEVSKIFSKLFHPVILSFNSNN